MEIMDQLSQEKTFSRQTFPKKTFPRKSGDVVIWGSEKGWLSNALRNKKIKSQNGNGRINQVLKLYHWNKGNGWVGE